MLCGWEGNPQAWRKVMEAYRRVDGFKSPAGWLPVHRDQLRAQCSVTSMGELYPFLVLYPSTVLAEAEWLIFCSPVGNGDDVSVRCLVSCIILTAQRRRWSVGRGLMYRYTVVRTQFPRPRHAGVGEEFSDCTRQWRSVTLAVTQTHTDRYTHRQTNSHIQTDTHTIRQRIEFKLAVLVYKALHGQLLQHLAEDCQLLTDIGRWSLWSADVLTCVTRRTRTRLGDRSFSVAGPCLWNSLPVTLRDRDISLVQFKRLLKTLNVYLGLPCIVTVAAFLHRVQIFLLTYRGGSRPWHTQTRSWPTQMVRVIPMIPTYTTSVGLPKVWLAFDWPTQMKIPRTAPAYLLTYIDCILILICWNIHICGCKFVATCCENFAEQLLIFQDGNALAHI